MLRGPASAHNLHGSAQLFRRYTVNLPEVPLIVRIAYRVEASFAWPITHNLVIRFVIPQFFFIGFMRVTDQVLDEIARFTEHRAAELAVQLRNPRLEFRPSRRARRQLPLHRLRFPPLRS